MVVVLGMFSVMRQVACGFTNGNECTRRVGVLVVTQVRVFCVVLALEPKKAIRFSPSLKSEMDA